MKKTFFILIIIVLIALAVMSRFPSVEQRSEIISVLKNNGLIENDWNLIKTYTKEGKKDLFIESYLYIYQENETKTYHEVIIKNQVKLKNNKNEVEVEIIKNVSFDEEANKISYIGIKPLNNSPTTRYTLRGNLFAFNGTSDWQIN